MPLSEVHRVNKHYSIRNFELIVDVLVRLEPSGNIVSASIVDEAKYRSDANFKALANSALRAIYDCSPLPLPSEKYLYWKEFVFAFDPRFMNR